MLHLNLWGDSSCLFRSRSLSRKDMRAFLCWSLILAFIIFVAVLFFFITLYSHIISTQGFSFGINKWDSFRVFADIWSLGVILFMLVCGQPPFQEANDSETLTMIMDCKYTVPPHISHACGEWVTHAHMHTSPRRWTESSAGAAYFMSVDVWSKARSEERPLFCCSLSCFHSVLQSAAPPQMWRCVKCV